MTILLVIQLSAQITHTNKEKLYTNFPRVIFDFDKRDAILIPSKIKEGEFYQVEIRNINLNRYQVIIEATDTIFSRAMDFPVFGTLDLTQLAGFVAALSTPNAVTKMVDAQLKSYKKGLPFDQTILKNFSHIDSSFQKLIEEARTEKMNAPTLEEQIDAQVTEIKAASAKYLTDLELIKTLIDNHNFKYMVLRNSRFSLANPPINQIDIVDDLRSFQQIREELTKQKENLAKDVERLTKFVESVPVKTFVAKVGNIAYERKLESAQKALTEASTQMENATAFVTTEKIDAQIKSVLYLYQHNTYKSLPIQFNGEEAILKIKFIPKDSTSGLQHEVLSKIKFPPRQWYWTVGASLYYSKLVNERLGSETVQINDTTSRFRATKEADLSNELGVAVLLRAGYRFPKTCFGIHVAAGSGVSLGDEVQPRALLGGGITIGQKHSLAMDGGFIAGYVKRASDNVNFEKDYIEKPSLIVNGFDTSFFLSVGYAYRL